MAEYAGYVRRQPPINWGTVAGDIVNKMGDIEKEQAAFREKYDTMAADISKEIGEYEAGKSPAFNDLVYGATAEGREMIAEMHNKLKRREISPDEFNRMKMSISNQWADFSTLTKNYNEAVAGTMEGLQNGELSGVSQWALDQFGELANLKNKRLQWMPNDNGYTNLYVTSTDDEGNMVGEPTSVTTLTNPGNLAYLRVDVPEEVSKYTDKLATYKIGRTSSPKEREGYEKYLNTSIDAITSTDNDVASILSEYDGTEFYKSSEEPIKGGIEMTTDENGNWKPVITDEQRKRAKEIVREQFEFQVPYTKTFREYDPSDDKAERERLNNLTTGYEITLNASRGDFTGMNKSLYTFKKTKNGIEVKRKTDTKNIPIHAGKDALKPGTRETARILSQYTREFSASGSQTEWDEVDAYLGEGKGKDVSIDIVEQEVEGKPFTPTGEDITIQTLLWNGGGDAGHEGVDNADSEEEINAVKPSIISYIQKNAPNTEVTFGAITEVVTDGDYTYSVPLYINGVLVENVIFDEYKGSQDSFDTVMKKAIDAGRKKKTATFTQGKEKSKPNLNASTRNG